MPVAALASKRPATLGEACWVCITKCKELVRDSVAPGLQYKDQCKQLHRFAKSLLIPLEDLSDNVIEDSALEGAGVARVKLLEAAIDRGLKLVHTCANLGRIQALMTANRQAADFANVAQDLMTALEGMDLAKLGCDEITLKQVGITLEQLAKVQAPYPEEQQRSMIQLSKLSESMRVAAKAAQKGMAPPQASKELREMMSKVLHGCEMRQLVMDRALLREQKRVAVERKDYVDEFFCNSLLDIVRELLPDGSEPAGADLKATVIIHSLGDDAAPELDATQTLVASIPRLVQTLADALLEPDSSTGRDPEGDPDTPPKKSAKQLEQEAKGKVDAALGALDEVLELTCDMPESDLQLKPAEAAAELVSAGIVEPLVRWLEVARPVAARLKAAEALERLVALDPQSAEIVVMAGGVSKCLRAMAAQDAEVKAATFKPGNQGGDVLTPRVRAARLLRTLCEKSETARANVARPPPPRKVSKPAPRQSRTDASSRGANGGRTPRLSEKVRRLSEASSSSAGSEADSWEGALPSDGGMSIIVQLLAKVVIREPKKQLTAAADVAGARVKPAFGQGKAKVPELSDRELEELKDPRRRDMGRVMLKILAAQILELLAAPPTSAVLVAAGGILAAIAALRWDVHPDVNTACANVLHKLASEQATYLQMALEGGACAALAELTASEDPEERDAAVQAITVLMKGSSTRPALPPSLGATAAAATLRTKPAAAAPDVNAPAPAAHRKGGGHPKNSVRPLLELVTLKDESTLAEALHSLATAAQDPDLRLELLSIDEDMRSAATPAHPLQDVTHVACKLGHPAAGSAFSILQSLCLVPEQKARVLSGFRPLLAGGLPNTSGTAALQTGAVLRLAALLPPPQAGAAHVAAAGQCCKDLAADVPLVSTLAVATKNQPSDLAALAFLSSFCSFCDSRLLASVVRRAPDAPDSLPPLHTRLVALLATTTDAAIHAHARVVLQRLVHDVPTMRPEILTTLLTNMSSAETPAAREVVTRSLAVVLTPPTAHSATKGGKDKSEIPGEMKRLVGAELHGVAILMKALAEAPNSVKEAAGEVLVALCIDSQENAAVMRSARCKVTTTEATGKPKEVEMDSLGLLLYALRDAGGTVVTRACSCALLGQLSLLCETRTQEAPCPLTTSKLTPQQIAKLCEGDADLDPADFAPRRTVRTVSEALRVAIHAGGAVPAMLDALFEVSQLLYQMEPPQAGAVPLGPGEVRAALRSRADAPQPKSSAPRPDPATPNPHADRIAAVHAVKHAALRGVCNMTFGEPAAARDDVCKEVVRRLKTGTPAQKQGCAEVLQFVTASAAARAPLYTLQVLPGLVHVCSTGVPRAQQAAAEALTNMAAVSETPLAPQRPKSDKLALPDTSGTQASRTAGNADAERTINLKLEVQRAGAVPALTAMLRGGDEGCVQAAANALYVLATEPENRAMCQSSGVVDALQAVAARSKLRPPTVSARTARDCNEALMRIL